MDTGIQLPDSVSWHYLDCPNCRDQNLSPYNWNWLPVAVCISLREREDRVKESSLQFHKIGLCQRVIYYRPTRDKKPARGCWESHRKIAKIARDVWKLDKIAVFEDDVLFADNIAPQRINNLDATLDSLPKNWNAFYLGHWSVLALPRQKGVNRSVSFCTHAYIMNKPLMTWMVKHPFDNMPLPKVLPSMFSGIDIHMSGKKKMYSMSPMIAYQSGSPGNIQTASLAQWALSDPKYMKSSEKISRVGTVLLIIVLLLFMAKFLTKLKN